MQMVSIPRSDKAAIGLVAAVGEAFEHGRDLQLAGDLLDEAGGLAEDRQISPDERSEQALGDRPIALGLVVEGPVRLDILDRHARPVGQGADGDELGPHHHLQFASRDHLVATAEPLAVGIARVSADNHPSLAGPEKRLIAGLQVTRVSPATDAGRGDPAEQGIIPGKAFAEVSVEVDGSTHARFLLLFGQRTEDSGLSQDGIACLARRSRNLSERSRSLSTTASGTAGQALPYVS
jgi:hypothetical protein